MRLRYLLVAISVFTLASQGLAQGCKEWDWDTWDPFEPVTAMKEFFESATAMKVADCLRAGVDVNVRGFRDRTPLHWAVAYEADLGIIRTLVEAGADVNAKDWRGLTPLHLAPDASFRYHLNGNYTTTIRVLVDILVDAGADVNARSNDGETPLHRAALQHDKAAVILALVDAGADVNVRNENGSTPLYWALIGDHPVSALILVAAGADVKAKDRWGDTPLQWAVLRDKPSPTLIKALLAAGANVNSRDATGWTPLYSAVSFGHNRLVVVEILLASGARVDIPGYSPLHHAAQRADDPAIIEALLNAGADATARDPDGKTPWDYAQDNEALRDTNAWWRLREGRFR